MEKQKLTQSFLEQQQTSTVSQAETRLSDLQEKREQLRELQEQINSLSTLPDCQLIQVDSPHVPHKCDFGGKNALIDFRPQNSWKCGRVFESMFGKESDVSWRSEMGMWVCFSLYITLVTVH